MLCFPNAKINIGLNIISKRPDGFHNLESVFYPIGLCDILEVIENSGASKSIEFSSTGISIPGAAGSNLCEKAYHLIAQEYALPKVKIHLHKIIPIGAGLGGGSSDAAFFIRMLNEKFELGISWGEQHNYARQLGSDCSFFITNKPAYATEKGDVLESINLRLEGLYFVLVYPNILVNTGQAYAAVRPKNAETILEAAILEMPINKWKNCIKNDFEVSVFQKYPELAQIKQKMYDAGAVYASMSGSGSAVYGLFEKKINATKEFPEYFIWSEQIARSS